MTCYKFLAAGATGPFSGFTWPTPPAPGTGGDWVVVDGPLEPCRRGLHLCRSEDLPFWVLEELYTVEVDGPLLEHDDFVIARRARLLRRVDTWGRAFASSFSRECAVLVRDLTAGALRRTGRGEAADMLLESDAAEELHMAAQRLLDGGRDDVPLVGYLQDAARFASSVASGPRWAADAATVGFISATAARVGAEPGAEEAAVAHERARQATWLSDHVLATV